MDGRIRRSLFMLQMIEVVDVSALGFSEAVTAAAS
jgi:hypothetical protein